MSGQGLDGITELDTMRNLITDYQNGYALPRHFYTSQAVYENDIKAYWNASWIWVGHISQIQNPGDFFLFEYGTESVIVARDREENVGAFLNVCRHRGSRVCVEKSGTTRVFACPYHAWTYELNGKLRVAREMGDGFDPSKYGLFKAHVRVFQGLIFICTAETPPAIDQGLDKLAPMVAPFGFENLKIAHSASYSVPANWKLAIENYMECYHCAPAHKEYSRSHSLKDPDAKTEELTSAMYEKSARAGLPTKVFEENGADGIGVETDFFYRRYPLFPGYESGSKSGKPVAPLLGDLKEFDGGTTDIQIGILNNFLAYSDYVVGYRFIPAGLQETNIEVVWFVRADAEEGKDYDKAELTWLWHVTSQDDERIIRVNQEGVNSNHFEPGPLSEMEWGIRAFYQGYLDKIK